MSSQIIDGEADDHGFPPDAWQVVRRVIHTSADFEWLKMIRMHPKAIASGVAAIRSGCTIITDTNMARAGIRQRDLTRFGVRVGCYMTDERVAETAAREGITRAKAAVDEAAPELSGGIYVVGKAPTARLLIFITLGLVVGQTIEATGWTRRLAVVILSFAAEFTSGFAAAGALMEAGVLTIKQTVIALLAVNFVAFPIRALPHQLPRYMGIFSPAMGLQLLLLGQTLRVISLVAVGVGYFLFF